MGRKAQRTSKSARNAKRRRQDGHEKTQSQSDDHSVQPDGAHSDVDIPRDLRRVMGGEIRVTVA